MWRILLLFVLLIGCKDNPPPIYPTTAPLNDAQLTLGPGDKVELVVYHGTRQSKAIYVLDASGEVEVQFIGTIVAGGKTAKAVQEEVEGKLADGYFVEPIVS